jgi:outer membrane protein assembly factor BamB
MSIPEEKIMQRHKYLALLLILLLFCFSCAKKEAQDKAVDFASVSWPIFRGDPALRGITDDELPEELRLLWSFQTDSWIIGSPVLGLGRVYSGSSDGKVYAINLSDGKKVWEFDTQDDIEASPLLLEGAVYVGNLSGEFFCLDAGTGQVRWEYKCDNSIYGSANWVINPQDQRPCVLVGCYDNRLYCFDAETGELNWLYETDNYINGAPSTDGEHVVFGGCDELLHILSVVDGTKIGEVWAGSYIPGSAALAGDKAYLGHYDNKLVCIDRKQKKIEWEYYDEDNPDAFFSSPAVGKDRVLIGSRNDHLYCVDSKTGKKIWAFATRDDIDSSPVIAGEKVVFGSLDGRLYIVDLNRGKELWSYEIGAPLFSCPAVDSGIIVIGSDDGRIYAFGEKR